MDSREVSSLFTLVFLLFFLTLSHPGYIHAQSVSTLELKTMAEKEVRVKKDGKWIVERIPLDSGRPGDRIVYTISYQNIGKTPLLDATVVDPVPAGTIYLPDSAEGMDAEITCSGDGGRSFQKPPLFYRVKKPDGTLESRPTPADRYTHIRWVIKKPVPPGASGRVSFMVTVK